MTTDDDLANWTYEEFCNSPYLALYIECSRRGWTGEKLTEVYEQAILTWQRDGFTGKPPLKPVLEAILDGLCDDILFPQGPIKMIHHSSFCFYHANHTPTESSH